MPYWRIHRGLTVSLRRRGANPPKAQQRRCGGSRRAFSAEILERSSSPRDGTEGRCFARYHDGISSSARKSTTRDRSSSSSPRRRTGRPATFARRFPRARGAGTSSRAPLSPARAWRDEGMMVKDIPERLLGEYGVSVARVTLFRWLRFSAPA